MRNHSGEQLLFEYVKDLIYTPQMAALEVSELPDNMRQLGEELRFLGECLKEKDALSQQAAPGDTRSKEDAMLDGIQTIQDSLHDLIRIAEQPLEGTDQKAGFMHEFSDAFQDLEEQLKSQKRILTKTAYTDGLTGVWNRMYSIRVMSELWDMGHGFSIGMVNLDRLKYCNDRFGRSEGDRYIQSVCQTLEKQFGSEGSVFRMEGDEFLVLSETLSAETMDERMEAARQEYIDEYAGVVDYPRSFSYGCVYADPKQSFSYRKFLGEADRRMYHYRYVNVETAERGNGEKPAGSGETDLNLIGLGSRAFDAFAESSDERYLFMCNMDTNVSRWSRSIVEEFDLPGEYMYDAGNIWLERIHPDDREIYLTDLEAVFTGKKQNHDVTYRAKNKQGIYIVCTCKGYLMKGNGQGPDIFAGTIYNHGVIDDVDSVTGLYNVYKLMDALRRCKAEAKPVNILMVGISQFRRVNNTYGYICGNQILQKFGQKLQELVRKRGMAFRLNGTKFALLTEVAGHEDTERLYQEVNDIARNELYLGDSRVSLAVCGGALSFHKIEMEETAVLAELEYALGISKQEEQGELVYFDDSLHGSARRKLEMIDAIIRSVLYKDFGGFYLMYQPQVQVDGTVIGAEALVRWRDEVWGVIPPIEFIPILENDRCFYELGLWILQTALRGTKPIIQSHPDFKISVNVSYRQLEHVNFKTDVISIVRKMDFPTQNLILELTEHCSSVQQSILQENLEYLQRQGIHIAADDFGTGHSSLALLRDLSFDSIKIDRKFIADIVVNPADQYILKSTIQCARDFGISVCVEGVEDVETLEMVDTYKPNTYQGFLFSRPIMLSQLEKLFEEPGTPRIVVEA